MIIREAKTEDIQRMQVIRNSVTENTLSDPALVTDDDYQEFITLRGKGWVCEVDHQLVGFSIVDLHNHNIWALFLLPEFEKQGIGTQLHDVMLDWYFTQTENTVWLGTSPGTRPNRRSTRDPRRAPCAGSWPGRRPFRRPGPLRPRPLRPSPALHRRGAHGHDGDDG